MLIHEIYHPHVLTIPTDTSLGKAMKKMEEHQVNSFVITNEYGRIQGILSLQDIAGAIVPQEFKDNIGMAQAMYKRGYFHEACQEWKDIPVSRVMRRDFLSVNLETNIFSVMADFLKGDLYIVPVIEAGKCIGIVTRTEIRKALLDGFNKKAPKN